MFKNLIRCIALGPLLGVVAGAANAEIVAYWSFDEGSGNIATDIVGGFEAQLTDIDWVVDQFGGSAVLSSQGSDSILVDPAPTPTTQDLSLAWWMVDTYDSWHTMMNKSTDSSQAGYSILLRPTAEDSPLRFRIGGFQAYGGWGEECRLPGGAYADGEWVHITCTYDNASDTATIYVNAEVKPYGDYNPKVGGIAGPDGYCQGLNDPTQPLYIVGQRETFGGTVDDVAIWDHALSAGDVMKVFTLGPLMLDPRLAGKPSPEDEATDVPRDTSLEWRPGESAATHDVYIGTVFNDVNDAGRGSPLLVGDGQTATTYDPPARLEFGTTYYWRIDETTTDGTTFKGAVWSFTTEPVAYPVDGATITVTASSAEEGQGPENTINGSGLTDDLHSDEPTDMWLTALGAAGPAWIEFEFNKVLKLHEMWVWNQNTALETAVGLGAKDVTLECSTDRLEYTVLEGVPQFSRAPGKAGYAANTTVDLGGIAARYVKLTINSNWGDILQQYGLSEVRFFSVPVFAREPSPMPGQKDVDVTTDLTWRAGREAATHEVYLSTDEQAVTDGSAPMETVNSPSYTLALDLASAYYWRVDEVNEVETPSTWQGDVWGFSTQEFVVVDGFEDYTDDMDAGEAVFQTWKDGIDVPANGGSVVGLETSANGTFCNTTTVHSGRQAMPLKYDNTTATHSEATRTLPGQNWTRHGVKALVLWLYGSPDNVAQQMYVKINNTKVAYPGSADDLKQTNWRMWYIPLASYNVNNVTSVGIGLERIAGVGGQGELLIDDLRLYSRDREQVTPVAPDAAGLKAHWKLDETSGLTAADSSGSGNTGTLTNMTGNEWTTGGKVGGALALDGVDDYVDCGNAPGLRVTGKLTIAAWVKMKPANEAAYMGIAGKLVSGDYKGFALVRHSSNVFRLWVASAGNIQGVSSDATYTDAEWHHVAGVSEDGISSLYIDGFKQAGTLVLPFDESGDFAFIGKQYSTTTDRHWNGTIDDVRMYDRALSEAEVGGLAGLTAPYDKSF